MFQIFIWRSSELLSSLIPLVSGVSSWRWSLQLLSVVGSTNLEFVGLSVTSAGLGTPVRLLTSASSRVLVGLVLTWKLKKIHVNDGSVALSKQLLYCSIEKSSISTSFAWVQKYTIFDRVLVLIDILESPFSYTASSWFYR